MLKETQLYAVWVHPDGVLYFPFTAFRLVLMYARKYLRAKPDLRFVLTAFISKNAINLAQLECLDVYLHKVNQSLPLHAN